MALSPEDVLIIGLPSLTAEQVVRMTDDIVQAMALAPRPPYIEYRPMPGQPPPMRMDVLMGFGVISPETSVQIGVDMAEGPDRTAVTPAVPAPDPRLAAEILIRQVLPDDLSVSLSAIGSFDYQAKQFRYKLFKGQKTHCFQADKTFSCCIQLEDSTAPDADRIVAEFLLLRNDEPKYLATANLTQIAGPRDQRPTVDGARLQWRADEFVQGYTMRQYDAPPRIGDTIQVRYPTWHAGRPDYHNLGINHAQIIAQESFRMLFGQPPFERPYREFRLEEIQGLYDRLLFTEQIDPFTIEGHTGGILTRCVVPAVERLRHRLSPQEVNLIGFWPTPPGIHSDERYHVEHQGKHLSVECVYDVRTHSRAMAIHVGAIVPR